MIVFIGTIAGAPVWALGLVVGAWGLRYAAKNEMHPVFERGDGLND